jgi:hypothetical protein
MSASARVSAAYAVARGTPILKANLGPSATIPSRRCGEAKTARRIFLNATRSAVPAAEAAATTTDQAQAAMVEAAHSAVHAAHIMGEMTMSEVAMIRVSVVMMVMMETEVMPVIEIATIDQKAIVVVAVVGIRVMGDAAIGAGSQAETQTGEQHDPRQPFRERHLQLLRALLVWIHCCLSSGGSRLTGLAWFLQGSCAAGFVRVVRVRRHPIGSCRRGGVAQQGERL